MSKEITSGDMDLVAEVMAICTKNIAALVEGKFLDSFKVEFEIEGKKFTLTLTSNK